MSAKAGLRVCAAIDAHGGSAPWREYMTGYVREVRVRGISEGDIPDEALSLEWWRGRLRLSADAAAVELETGGSAASTGFVTGDTAGENPGSGGERRLSLSAPVDGHRLGRWMETRRIDPTAVAVAVFDTHGVEGVVELIGHLEQPGPMSLALAEHLADNSNDADVGTSREWAIKAAEDGLPPGALHSIIALGVPFEDVNPVPTREWRQLLLDLTRTVQEPSIRWENEALWAWLDACIGAAHRDPPGLDRAQRLVRGEGWYKCWLRFVIGLVRAEAAETNDRVNLIGEAFQHLKADLDPFSGNPRACDLNSIHHIIASTVQRALVLVDGEDWTEAFRLLREVSSATKTHLYGSVNDLLPADILVGVSIDRTHPRLAMATELLEAEIRTGSADRYYSDLAECYLLWARVALAADNHEEANGMWDRACRLLTAYGWRKDLTIFELLNPLPTLMAADRSRSRELVARLQPLCKRVPRHTDGSETNHAPPRWWELFGRADPVAAAKLTAARLLNRCNDPHWVLHGALEDLWTSWCGKADPLLSALLRFTLDTPLHANDPDVLSRLAEDAQRYGSATVSLMVWLLARADERPVEYAFSNSDELVEADDHKIAELNDAAKDAGLPDVIPIRDYVNGISEHPDPPEAYPQPPGHRLTETPRPSSFAPGAAGLAEAIRAWQMRPYEPESEEWSVDRFAEELVPRLVELAEAGRQDDATRALRTLVRGYGSKERVDLMQQIADGLERSGQSTLATISCTLGWTGAHGGDTGRFFGGAAGIPALRRATQKDPELAQRIIAEEIEHLIETGYPTNGVSQALVHAFAVEAINVPDRQSTDVAFEVWEKVFAVINDRAPVLHLSDEPQDPYEPEEPPEETTQTQVDLAFALATVASLSHASRERKRRTLLAIRCLLEERPGLAAEALQVAFAALTEPATLVWLLQLLLELSTPHRTTVIAKCEQELSQHATGPYLVVRALTRRLLGTNAPPMPPSSASHPSLPATPIDPICVPDDLTNGPPITDDNADGFVQAMAQHRLSQAESVLPGIGHAVSARFATAMKDDDRKRRLERQRREYADYGGERWPDALLVPEETLEEVLQETAAGGHAAKAQRGEVVANPVAWEDQLADMLADDPVIPLAVEGRRIPRPPIPAPPPRGSNLWVDASARAGSGHQDLCGTLAVQPASTAWIGERGPYSGWRMIASAERRTHPYPDPLNHDDLRTHRYRAIEFRNPNDTTGLDWPPLTEGDIRWWRTRVEKPACRRLPDGPVPVAALDCTLAAAEDGPRLLGIPTPILTPVPALIALLKLQPAQMFTLTDQAGHGIDLVTWRSAYETPTNSIARPRLVGSALMLRPDLFKQLEDTTEDSLTLRDFVAGDPQPASDT